MDTAERALAEAVPANLLLAALITRLVQRGILSREDAMFLVDFYFVGC